MARVNDGSHSCTCQKAAKFGASIQSTDVKHGKQSTGPYPLLLLQPIPKGRDYEPFVLAIQPQCPHGTLILTS